MGAYKVRRRRSMVFEGDGGGGGGGSPLWRQGRPVKNPRFPSARFARRLAQNKTRVQASPFSLSLGFDDACLF